jgi:hypothetical protein
VPARARPRAGEPARASSIEPRDAVKSVASIDGSRFERSAATIARARGSRRAIDGRRRRSNLAMRLNLRERSMARGSSDRRRRRARPQIATRSTDGRATMFGAFYKTFMSVRARERARARRRARATARGRRAGASAREAATIERAISTTTGEGGARRARGRGD